MVEEKLTKELILDTTEAVLRKFGPAKTNMSDVARALGVSHAALYRHYDNKSALRSAVVERWLDCVIPVLQAVTSKPGAAERRLYEWLDTLRRFKRERAQSDPELFAMYALMVAEAEGLLESHVEELLLQLTSIIRQGVEEGVFRIADPKEAAWGCFLATTRFHHPSHASEWTSPDQERWFAAVWQLLLKGLTS